MKNKLTKNQGVTLVALVVTIIVLVILATVSIGMVLGNQGIFTQAEEAKKITANAQTAEEEGFNQLYEELAGYINGNSNKPEMPTLPSTAETSPYLPKDSIVIENSTLDNGLTIKDKNNNEWVWVEVPKSVTASAIDEATIYTALENYAATYRSNYTDTWYEGCGLTEIEYNTNKAKMLNSIKIYGGFWIGRYELGTDIIRTTPSMPLVKLALIQPDKYLYNYITCSQAQELCSELSPEENITSSMLYGIQWDLTLKFMEQKATELGEIIADRQAKLKTDSSTWGNYNDAIFNVTRGSYSIDGGRNYTAISGDFTKISNKSILLTTGITSRNRVLNIYDLAGNDSEWTLEKSNYDSKPCTYRGGYYGTFGSSIPASNRSNYTISNSEDPISSRSTLFK